VLQRVKSSETLPRHRASSPADEDDGFEAWRITANIQNKLQCTADKGWSPTPGFENGPCKSPQKKTGV
jgi:hypothetical protein